jgi:hypothetical protein
LSCFSPQTEQAPTDPSKITTSRSVIGTVCGFNILRTRANRRAQATSHGYNTISGFLSSFSMRDLPELASTWQAQPEKAELAQYFLMTPASSGWARHPHVTNGLIEESRRCQGEGIGSNQHGTILDSGNKLLHGKPRKHHGNSAMGTTPHNDDRPPRLDAWPKAIIQESPYDVEQHALCAEVGTAIAEPLKAGVEGLDQLKDPCTSVEFARLLGKSPKTIVDWCQEREYTRIPCFRLGNRWYHRTSELKRWLNGIKSGQIEFRRKPRTPAERR